MTNTIIEELERLIRVQTTRRGDEIELRVHYAARSEKGCKVYSILGMDETD